MSCRCPYYRFAESPLYGQLPGVNDTDALWFDDLANLVSPVSDVKAQKFISVCVAFTPIHS